MSPALEQDSRKLRMPDRSIYGGIITHQPPQDLFELISEMMKTGLVSSKANRDQNCEAGGTQSPFACTTGEASLFSDRRAGRERSRVAQGRVLFLSSTFDRSFDSCEEQLFSAVLEGSTERRAMDSGNGWRCPATLLRPIQTGRIPTAPLRSQPRAFSPRQENFSWHMAT